MNWGLTGGEGFIGTCLRRHAGFLLLPRPAWNDRNALAEWSEACDVIVHLAGMSRSDDGAELYRVNMELCSRLAEAIRPGQLVIFGSTTHIDRDTPYHASKRDGAKLLSHAAAERGAKFVELLMSNTFGPGGKPFFNSVVPTFCFQAARGETPRIDDPKAKLALIHVDDLCEEIVRVCRGRPEGRVRVEARYFPTVGELAARLLEFAAGASPRREDEFDLRLFECFAACREELNGGKTAAH